MHHALLHDVIGGLKQGDRPVSSLVADDRWNIVRSSIPWHSWQRELHLHGLPGCSEAWTGTERATSPILDLLLLGECPGIEPGVMLDLVVALGPYLRTSQEWDAVQADRGPLGWAPVRLHLPAGAFEFTDGTGGQETYGPTKHGLVRVERAGRYVGTLKPSRWGWLAATYAAEVMCEALPS